MKLTPISLSEVFRLAGIVPVDPVPDHISTTGITESTAELKAGMVFVAREGTTFNGHDFLDIAATKGACAAIVNEKPLNSNGLPTIRVADTAEALGRLCAGFYGNPSHKMRVIGVTGTDGKSTTSHLVAHLLRTGGYKVAITSTVGTEIGGKTYPMRNTTPPAPLLQQFLAEAACDGNDYVVVEVSSHAVVQKRLAGCRFCGGILTNVAADHLELHQSIKNYREAKRRFFKEYVAADGNNPDAWQVLNKDDLVGKSLAALNGVRTIHYSALNSAHLQARRIVAGRNRIDFEMVIQGKVVSVRLPLTGRYNVWNALAAAGAGVACEIPLDLIQEGLETFCGVKGRFEYIHCGLPFDVIIDYAHTPQAVSQVLRESRQLTTGRLIAVFGSPGDRWPGKRGLIGKIIGEHADFAVITSDNPGFEDPAAIAHAVVRGLKIKPPPEGYAVELDRARALELAISAAWPGDMVLLLGKGHEEFQMINGVRYPFSEREVVLQYSKVQPVLTKEII
ncbi:MAG: UDP-N-acetylmuramoyl-L-alanyl-D-glutamate--2,6-diaminopimelate ligase [Thermodesulfobacteriota bacterium]